MSFLFEKSVQIVGVLRLPGAGKKKKPQSLLNTFSFQPTQSLGALLAIATDRVVTSEKNKYQLDAKI